VKKVAFALEKLDSYEQIFEEKDIIEVRVTS
jgi:hypothetical protein